MSLLIERLSKLTRALNPNLLNTPPSCSVESKDDICFVGVLCNELGEGQRCVVGSWYLDPERLAIEFIVFTIIFTVSIKKLWKVNTCSNKDSNLSLYAPSWLKVHTFISTLLACAYKLLGFEKKILFMAMPCNTIWILHSIFCLDLFNEQFMHAYLQVNMSYLVLTILALLAPDLGDLTLPGEVVWFFFQHYMLFIFPIYYLVSGRFTTLTSKGNNQILHFLKWWLLSCTLFGFYYFTIITPIAILHGLNLNYMLSPPKLPVDFVKGENFRIISAGLCASGFFMMRLIISLLEALLHLVLGIACKKDEKIKLKKTN